MDRVGGSEKEDDVKMNELQQRVFLPQTNTLESLHKRRVILLAGTSWWGQGRQGRAWWALYLQIRILAGQPLLMPQNSGVCGLT